MDKKLFNDILKSRDKKSTYLYHFIIVKYRNNNDIKIIKIDQFKDLVKLENLDIICIYFIEKIHYYTGEGNYFEDLGEPYHIFKIGYYFINGDIMSTNEEMKCLMEKINNYERDYDTLEFPFTKESFLLLNKSVINY